MDILTTYRRPALKLIARVRRLGKQEVRAGSRAALLTVLAALVVVAWCAIAVNRVGLAGAKDASSTAFTPRGGARAVPVSQGAGRSTTLSKRDAMVYILAGDDRHFHAPVHAAGANRQAVSVALAKSRGLVPCSACYRVK
jgi:hypothetical protein